MIPTSTAFASDRTAVTVQVFGPDNSSLPGRTVTYDDLVPVDGGVYSSYDDDHQLSDEPSTLTGQSLDRLVGPLNISPANIGTADVTGVGLACNAHLSNAFDDFGDPTDADYPFERALPPIFAARSTADQERFTFAVPVRYPDRGDDTVTDGKYCDVVDTGSLALAVHLISTLLRPVMTAPAPRSAVQAGTPVAFRAQVADSDPHNVRTWTWFFGDGYSATTDEPSTTHTYAADGCHTCTAYVEVTSTNHSAAGRSVGTTITVSGTTTAPDPSTTPPVGPSNGAGNSTAPVAGPVVGSGPRIGGVPSSRPSGGRADASFDPRSPRPTSSGTGGSPARSGAIVGYLLTDGTATADPGVEAGATRRDDSAPAARSGVAPSRIGGWVLGAAVVVGLLAAGAGSERRRPARRGSQRPTRRAR